MGCEVKPEKEHRICTPCKKESDKLEDMKKDVRILQYLTENDVMHRMI